MTSAPCGDPDCPVAPPSTDHISVVSGIVLRSGSRWWRSTRFSPTDLVSEVGNTRFAPLPDVHHGYFGSTRTVALLESTLHSAAGPSPTIYIAHLDGWAIHEVELTVDIELADFRNDQLTRMGLARPQLITTTIQHYPCTRQWASAIHGSSGTDLGGVVWHSRQAELHAEANPGGLLGNVLRHTTAEVAVVWSPPGVRDIFRVTGERVELVENGSPARIVDELAHLIGAVVT